MKQMKWLFKFILENLVENLLTTNFIEMQIMEWSFAKK